MKNLPRQWNERVDTLYTHADDYARMVIATDMTLVSLDVHRHFKKPHPWAIKKPLTRGRIFLGFNKETERDVPGIWNSATRNLPHGMKVIK